VQRAGPRSLCVACCGAQVRTATSFPTRRTRGGTLACAHQRQPPLARLEAWLLSTRGAELRKAQSLDTALRSMAHVTYVWSLDATQPAVASDPTRRQETRAESERARERRERARRERQRAREREERERERAQRARERRERQKARERERRERVALRRVGVWVWGPPGGANSRGLGRRARRGSKRFSSAASKGHRYGSKRHVRLTLRADPDRV